MLSRTYRIPKSYFPAVTRGKVLQNDIVRIVIKQDTQLQNPKFAVIVANKIAKKAVTRNLLRRQIYSILKKYCNNAPKAFISIFPRKAETPFEVLEKNIEELLCLKK